MTKSELEDAAAQLEAMADKVQAATAKAVVELTSKSESIVDQLRATAKSLRELAALLPPAPPAPPA